MAAVSPIQVQKYLSGIDYPASKQDIIGRAREEGASQEIIATLEKMPGDRFNSPNDVSQAIGKIE
jgi:hypothetical protein